MLPTLTLTETSRGKNPRQSETNYLNLVHVQHQTDGLLMDSLVSLVLTKDFPDFPMDGFETHLLLSGMDQVIRTRAIVALGYQLRVDLGKHQRQKSNSVENDLPSKPAKA